MSTEIHIACDGKTADQVARETTQTLDAFIERMLADEERWALEQGFPPHVVDRQMQEYRQCCMATRDRSLARATAGLAQRLAIATLT